MPRVDLICLANSRKHGGRCVAGLRVDTGEWIRPISDLPDGALFWTHFRLQDGSEPRPLDLIRVPCFRRQPKPYQPENWLIGKHAWALAARPASKRTLAMLEPHIVAGPELLGNSLDRVAYAPLCTQPARSSLALVKPADLQWHIARSYDGHRQTRARFALGAISYNLVVTDPVWESRLASLDFGAHSSAAAGVRKPKQLALTISLSEPLGDYCYKLVSAVFELA